MLTIFSSFFDIKEMVESMRIYLPLYAYSYAGQGGGVGVDVKWLIAKGWILPSGGVPLKRVCYQRG